MEDLRLKQIYCSNTEPSNAIVGDIWAKEDTNTSDLQTIFDYIYPIGSYALGSKPALGTWTQVTGDYSLWINNTVADGTTVAQALPKPSITTTIHSSGAHDHYWRGYRTVASTSSGNHIRSLYWIGSDPLEVATNTDGEHTHTLTTTVATDSVYGAGTKVQPDAYVVTVWKRTA